MSFNQILKLEYEPGSEFVGLEYAYNRRFTDFVKGGITPPAFRRWDGIQKKWKVHVSKLPQIVSYGMRCFVHIDYQSLPEEIQIDIVHKIKGSKEANPRIWFFEETKEDLYSILFLTPDAPLEVIKAAYKALALKYHPDQGGDIEKFRKINEAYEKLCKKVN